MFRYLPLLLFFFLIVSCSSEFVNVQKKGANKAFDTPSLLLVRGQTALPQSFKSVQLTRKGSANTPPIMELGSNDKLILEFDELASISGQFTIRFSHHNKDWSPSNVPDAWLFDGINEVNLFGGEINQFYKPDYFHYKLEFPNRDIRFKISGQYLLHVHDYSSGSELFSMPFFVTEDEGELNIISETIFNATPNGSAKDQIFGKYIYPEFVEFPQFDLSYSFAQNRFWRETRFADEKSFTKEGITEFHLSRSAAFQANFDFSELDISELSLQNPKIFNIEPARIPIRVTLRDDVLNFLSNPKPVFRSENGNPKTSRTTQYANVRFRLNTDSKTLKDAPIYLIGDFNMWTISDRYKLNYQADLGVFQTSGILKQGIYSYKYVTVQNGVIDPFKLSDTLTKRDQEYIGFVYYRDPDLNYDRLLKTGLLNANY